MLLNFIEGLKELLFMYVVSIYIYIKYISINIYNIKLLIH